jgi:hypothetical protein
VCIEHVICRSKIERKEPEDAGGKRRSRKSSKKDHTAEQESSGDSSRSSSSSGSSSDDSSGSSSESSDDSDDTPPKKPKKKTTANLGSKSLAGMAVEEGADDSTTTRRLDAPWTQQESKVVFGPDHCSKKYVWPTSILLSVHVLFRSAQSQP